VSDGSVLLVEDEKIIRDTISDDLIKEGYAVTTAENGEDGFKKYQAQPCDVVITDLIMEGMDGIELSKKLKHLDPDTPIMVLTGYPSIDTAIEALRLGVFDYILKPCERKELALKVANCFSSLEESQSRVASSKSKILIQGAGLTPREKEVCNLIRKGYENKEISSRLFICLNTTKNHIKRIYKKLNIKSRAQLVALLNQ
jgi:DNA-binding NarL/FixJ family response regulator